MPDLLDVHRDLLARFRRSMNLVGPGPLKEHFDDCERALDGLEPQGHWADLGSGAGFPGIPLAARWPTLRVDLVDSRRKRCTFLEHVLDEAEVPRERVRVICSRVEQLEGPYDGVVSRAFAAPAVFLDHAARLTRTGAQVVLFLQDDAHAPEDPRFERLREQPYALPGKRRKTVTLRRR